jgi:hypothetical protein
MNLSQRLKGFIELGNFLREFSLEESSDECSVQLREIVKNDHIYNPWFTESNIIQSLKAIGEFLQEEKVEFWIKKYPELENQNEVKKIGVITAGNIPLVGFHDFLSILISGNIFYGKLSSKDNRLLIFMSDYLISLNSEFKDLIQFTEDKLESFDAVIATGSDNTSRYFEYYFGKYPNIIRKNRSSVAVLDGNESVEDLKSLAFDIFSYFGLGCRNVSKLFFPKDYNLELFFENIKHFDFIYNHNKYANNYDYNRSVYLMNQVQHLDNGFVLLKEDENLSSPLGVLFFQYYDDEKKVKDYLETNEDRIQCVVSNSNFVDNTISFGNAQRPELWDYADNIDTMKFLLNL